MLALVCKRDAFNIHPCKCLLQGSLTEGLKSSDFRLFFDQSSQRLDCRQDIDDFGRGGEGTLEGQNLALLLCWASSR